MKRVKSYAGGDEMAKRDEKLEKRKKWNRDDQVSTFIFFDFILEIVLFLPRIIIHFIRGFL